MGLKMKLESLGLLKMDSTPCFSPARGHSVWEGGMAAVAALVDLGTELRPDTPPFPLPTSSPKTLLQMEPSVPRTSLEQRLKDQNSKNPFFPSFFALWQTLCTKTQ